MAKHEFYCVMQAGQAVEITVDGLATMSERVQELGKTVMLACAVPIRMAQRILGVGKLRPYAICIT